MKLWNIPSYFERNKQKMKRKFCSQRETFFTATKLLGYLFLSYFGICLAYNFWCYVPSLLLLALIEAETCFNNVSIK